MSSVDVAAVPMTAKRRGAQLFMLAFAVAIIMAAYASVGIGIDGTVPAGMLTYGLGLGGLMLVAYLVLAKFAPWADPLILPLVTLVNGLGLVMIYRIEQAPPSFQTGASAAQQITWTAVGIVMFTVTLIVLRDHRMLQRFTYTAGALGLVLLVLPLLPFIGREINGARIWINVGFSVQPGEFAKLALVVFFAGYLVAKRDVLALAGRRLLFIDLPRARDLGPILVIWGISVGILVLQKDLGTSLLLFGGFIVMLYIATQRTAWVLIGVLLFVGGAFLAGQIFSHVGARFEVWLDPGNNDFYNRPAGGSYQLMEGLFGLGSGGILGTGLGQGHPYRIPLAFSDFIFPAAGEELGLTGLMALLMCYGLIVERGLRTALAARDPFSKLFAGGLSFILAWQVFIIVGGVTNLIPLTGLVTPFMSQGGSALLANWMLIALLVRMSDAARRPPPQAIQDEGLTQVMQR